MMRFEASRQWVLPISFVILMWAWLNRFIQDDAFISFRYAEHLANGHGLVWNPDEHVEGYTNFLWTVLLSLAFRLKVDPIFFSWVVGLLCMGITLWCTWQIGQRLWGEAKPALLALLLLGINFSFNSYATGGLETSLFTALFAMGSWLGLLFLESNPCSLLHLCLWSLCAALMLLTRLDASVLLAAPALAVLWHCGHQETPRRSLVGVLCLGLPASILIVPWLAWKLAFYGDILPNTYYIKVSGIPLLRGAGYVVAFFILYGWWLLLPAFLRVLHERSCKVRRLSATWWPWGISCISWLLYVMLVGGDFMEFRMLIPVLPWLSLGAAAFLWRGIHASAWRWCVVLLMLAFSALRYAPIELHGIESVRALQQSAKLWRAVGEFLHANIAPTEGVVIATTAAGAIPFYSKLQAVDMLGLNDRWIAQHGLRITPSTRWFGNRPGHCRLASMDYLQQRGVHLVLNHPWIIGQQEAGALVPFTAEKIQHWPVFSAPLSAGTNLQQKIVVWPLPDNQSLITLYLTPHPAVDKAISATGARTYVLK